MSSVLETLQKKMQSWPVHDRVCSLINEILLKHNLYFDQRKDLVHGFADNGTERSPDVATSALVVLLAGLSKQWIQPIAIAIVSKKLSPADLRCLLLDIIQNLRSGEVLVKVLICDQGGSNRTINSKLGVTLDRPFFYGVG